MFPKFLIITVLLSASITAAVVRADEAQAPSQYSSDIVAALKSAISRELTQKFQQFGQPRIELGTLRLVGGTLPGKIQSVAFQGDNANGQAQFAVFGQDGQSAAVLADYAAWAEVRVASRRLMPGEHLTPTQFTVQQVNLATGMPYELRGVMLSKTEDVAQLETRQTILEGQYLVSTAVQKTPDVRKGDSVRIRVISGDLSLLTLGTAVEPGYSNASVKVVTLKTHRELTGTLQPGGVVEVKL